MKKKNIVEREQLIEALEGIVRDYRAGRGDVLSRVAYGRNTHSEGCVSLSSILALALFGSRAFPEEANGSDSVTYPDAMGILCEKKSEYLALVKIGDGSAEKGAVRVIEAATAWMKADRPGMVRWTAKALPKLSTQSVDRMAKFGMFGVESWDIPVAGEEWREALDAPDPSAPGLAPWQETGPGDLIRAMALAWERRDFPGRLLVPKRAA